MAAELLKGVVCGIGQVTDGCADRVPSGGVGLGEDGPAWAEHVMEEGVVEACHLPTIEGDHIAVGARYALDKSVEAQTAKVVGHGSA